MTGTEMKIEHLGKETPNLKVEAALSEGAGKHVSGELGCEL
jgi:hypothetical protein